MVHELFTAFDSAVQVQSSGGGRSDSGVDGGSSRRCGSGTSTVGVSVRSCRAERRSLFVDLCSFRASAPCAKRCGATPRLMSTVFGKKPVSARNFGSANGHREGRIPQQKARRTKRALWLHDKTGRDDIVLRYIHSVLAMEVTQSDVDQRAHTILTAPPRAVDRGRSASSSRWTRSGTPTSSPASSPPPPARPGWAVRLGLETARGCCCSVLHRPRTRADRAWFSFCWP